MIKTIKKISYIFIAVFIAAVVFLLISMKFNWSINPAFLPAFLIILALTVLCMLIVSISGIIKTIKKYGMKKFFKVFAVKLIFFFIALYAAAFIKKDINVLPLLGTSLALSVVSYYYDAE